MDKVKVILSAIEHLRSGDLSARTGLPPDSSELDCIGSALDSMAHALESRSRERDAIYELLQERERRYRALFKNIQAGFVLCEAVCDREPRLRDYRFLTVNPAFEGMIGLKSQYVLGRTLPEILPDIERSWLDACGKVTLTGEPLRFEHYSSSLGKHFEVFAFSPRIRQLAALFVDITARAEAQRRLGRQLDRLTALREIELEVTGSPDLEVTLDVILDRVVSLLGVDASSVLLIDKPTQTLVYAGGRGFNTDTIQKSRLGVREGCAGAAFTGQQVIYLGHVDRSKSDFTRTELLVEEDFVTYVGVPLIIREEVIGVLEIYNRTFFEPDSEWLEFLMALADKTAIALNNAQAIEELRVANINLSLANDRTLEGWSNALELRDDETEGHAQRVADMALCLAAHVGLSDVDLHQIRRGALLHDIGKIGIPDAILLNPGPLSDAEWEIMKLHPKFAYDLLAPIEFLKPALDIPYCHHERWDGSGYPRGLSGEQIPLAARIFAVVDVWDALLSDRPYRRAWPEEKVLAHLRHQAGKAFEPRVVEAFLEMIAADTPEMVKLQAEKIKQKIGTGQLDKKPELLPAA